MSEQAPNPQPDYVGRHRAEEMQAAPPLEEQRMAAFGPVAAFASSPDRQFAAGPDIRKATGLGHAEIAALGYGSYGELEHDAVAWKAEKDAADARAMARDEHMRRGAEQAKLWQNDRDVYRAERDKANAAVDKLAAAAMESVIKDVASRKEAKQNFKDRINGLGEVGEHRDPVNAARRKVEAAQSARLEAERTIDAHLKNNPQVLTQLRKEAIGWAEEDGFSTGHLQPRHFEVVRDKGAEGRTSELAKALRAHDAEILKAAAKRQQPDAPKAPQAAATTENQPEPRAHGPVRRTWNKGKQLAGRFLKRRGGRGGNGSAENGTSEAPEAQEPQATASKTRNTVEATARRRGARRTAQSTEGLDVFYDVADDDAAAARGPIHATARRVNGRKPVEGAQDNPDEFAAQLPKGMDALQYMQVLKDAEARNRRPARVPAKQRRGFHMPRLPHQVKGWTR